MAETTTSKYTYNTTGDQEEVDSVYHVILNDDLKDEFIKWLKDKNQQAVRMDKVNASNTWKNNDAFFGIGKYPIVSKTTQVIDPGVSKTVGKENEVLFPQEKDKTGRPLSGFVRPSSRSGRLNKELEYSKSHNQTEVVKDELRSKSTNSQDADGQDEKKEGGRKKRSRRKRSRRKKRTRKRN